MTKVDHLAGHATRGDYVVRAPRSTDAIGTALKGIFPTLSQSADMVDLLAQLDRITRH